MLNVQREKGDASKVRDFLPGDKQYLITRNGAFRSERNGPQAIDILADCTVPCLRRATAINYTDADEDAEKLLSFMDEVCQLYCLVPSHANGNREQLIPEGRGSTRT